MGEQWGGRGGRAFGGGESQKGERVTPKGGWFKEEAPRTSRKGPLLVGKIWCGGGEKSTKICVPVRTWNEKLLGRHELAIQLRYGPKRQEQLSGGVGVGVCGVDASKPLVGRHWKALKYRMTLP